MNIWSAVLKDNLNHQKYYPEFEGEIKGFSCSKTEEKSTQSNNMSILTTEC